MATVEEVVYHGTWRIIECVSVTGVVEITGIEGTEFILDENGDVSWQVPDETEPMPFFNCETYEVCPAAGSEPAVLKFIGTYAGYVVEFKVDISEDLMLLTYEKCCMLQCQKVSPGPRKEDMPYSFLSVLEHGYFSDLVLRADSGKEFKVHSIILQLSAPELDWTAPVTPLTGLPEDVLCVTLHYLYSECLPRGLAEETAQRCARMVGKMPGFARFGQLCETFLKNTALIQQIKSLVSDIHGCADRINDLFGGSAVEDGREPATLEGSLWSSPSKLCYTVRQALREEAIACAKLVLICDMFSKRKYELSREERYEIMKYVKSRIPVFLRQLLTLLTTIKAHLQALTQPQRADIAAYLVPEMEIILDTMSRFASETKAALEQAITTSNEKATVEKGDKAEKSRKSGVGDVLGRTLKHALHLKELKKLKHFHERTTSSFLHLRQKREHFNMKSQPDKIRSVSQSLVHLVDEFPSFVIKLREIIAALDDKVAWKEWKYLFKMATSKVSWGLAKVQSSRTSLQPMIDEMCDIVRSEQFVASLITLGLKSPAEASGHTTLGRDSFFSAGTSNKAARYAQLSCVDSLCVPPAASSSATARRALELFRQRAKTDMTFEVISLQDGGDIIIDHTVSVNEGCAGLGGKAVVGGDGLAGGHDPSIVETEDVEIQEIKAHRVIVAARCDWFRRALLSGMKESIDRKIIVHDTNPELFQRFLEALYSGQLDTSSLNAEQLADMMTLCDRYEMDNFKQVCEHELKSHLDEDNALCLLNLADHLNSRFLRDSALSYVVEHPNVTFSDLFEELPERLKEEVQDAIVWQGLEQKKVSTKGHLLQPSSSMSSLSDINELIDNIDISHDRDLTMSTSSSSDDLPYAEDTARLESCVQELTDIVGDTVSRDELTRVVLAADYDVNRALNFIFTS
ncbi:unnamed protein product [Candidula unifasciata]|uniref:BTB domain-containing protein n=1 Tax=Candidula unifasciata TaxID=100452 RepID=A0A8S3YUI4_9EUPU|nr:unnamed protein product [Candidula unifasciata]